MHLRSGVSSFSAGPDVECFGEAMYNPAVFKGEHFACRSLFAVIMLNSQT